MGWSNSIMGSLSSAMPWLSGDIWSSLGGYIANLAGCANLILKATIGVVFMIWMRWTLPRLRIDQVITMCWKYCVPIAAVGFLVVLGWQYFGLWSPNDLVPSPIRSEIRESWVETGAPSNDVGSLSFMEGA
jgi:NADH:ubiquinone oxidoreductase subunit H